MSEESVESTAVPKGSDQPRVKSQKLAAHYALPLSSVEAIIKIIKGYAVASNGGESAVNYKDVASATGLTPSVVSRNNTFLAESQIITSPKYGFYIPSEATVKFARESAWDEPNAKRHLRSIVKGTWFGSLVAQNFSMRSTLSRDDLKKVLAIKSGASEGDSDSLSKLIDFLSYIGIISESENGVFSRQTEVDVPVLADPINVVALAKEGEIPSEKRPERRPENCPQGTGTLGSFARVQINLNITIASISELNDGDALKLRAWIQNVLRGND
ncbi:MAG: hypothetical protein NTV51_22280 [Verrucomicrobia bacterium]|nr:hypothetical protein [Verrucomicrobiota bacterium]